MWTIFGTLRTFFGGGKQMAAVFLLIGFLLFAWYQKHQISNLEETVAQRDTEIVKLNITLENMTTQLKVTESQLELKQLEAQDANKMLETCFDTMRSQKDEFAAIEDLMAQPSIEEPEEKEVSHAACIDSAKNHAGLEFINRKLDSLHYDY